ncbi:hypothetical protein [Desulfoscipio geothermicus]|uniref:CRISPR-associated protein, APE2256 family n=1 Tax=Desulfoscipio geothermicus DSM 3669 TaxID=1121426 RepID=A0A1I6EDQ1_9FIRM|nr:hypothetical protein [Desulfoscipio geothermicus]SFR15886.1 CRISPR-associated protein, APE2256 family [Desulfoscipio geothermicus DSM 3669]
MIKVITTVGTSLFNNYLESNRDIENPLKHFKNKPFREYRNLAPRARQVKEKVTPWAAKSIEASAEIKSLHKIQKKLAESLDVYLLATDTAISALAAEIIQDRFAGIKDFRVNFNLGHDVIGGLQVDNYRLFVKTGLPNLVKRIEKIADSYFGNVVFNIAGGYKGVIPYLTVMALINNCDIYYIFEESQSVIEIPKVPLEINYSVFAKYSEEIEQLENGIEKYAKEKNKNYVTFSELEKTGLVEQLEGDMAFLSPLGYIFLDKYRRNYFEFYCSDEVWEEINKQRDIQRILAEKFNEHIIRQSKTETKGVHRVYDDGNNPNRIYYFEYGDNVYIYKTFQDEEAAREFIKTPLKREEVIKNAKKRKWVLANV